MALPLPRCIPDPDAKLRVGVTFSRDGSSEGHEFVTLGEAANAVRDWVLGIEPNLQDRANWRIDIETIEEDA